MKTTGAGSPAEPRSFPGIRWVRISLRTAHLIAMGLLVGGVAVGTPITALSVPLWGTVVTGALFVAIELYQSLVFLVQVKGMAVLAKLLLLVAAVAFPDSALACLVVAIVLGGFSSHMPGRYRYFSVVHWRSLKGPSG